MDGKSKFQDVSIAPMHTAEHILNQTMVRMFGCPRSRNAHIERKKSKCDYLLAECPSPEQVQAIEDKVNEVIAAALPVTIEFVPLSEAGAIVDLSKLPENVSDTLRIVRVGDIQHLRDRPLQDYLPRLRRRPLAGPLQAGRHPAITALAR